MPEDDRDKTAPQSPDPHAADTLQQRAASDGDTMKLADAEDRDSLSQAISLPEVPAQFRKGEVIADRYRIVSRLGAGGMGEVYKAEDLDLHEFVALKTVLPEAAKDETAIQRFKREIQLARRVTHPNVCRIFDVGYHTVASAPTQRTAFVTMELLPGETLTNVIRQKGKLSTQEALPLITQMAAGLEAAHRAGIVHRDFKPGNVMLVSSGSGEVRAVITDFGLARLAEADAKQASVTTTGVIVGSPAYMAPEQLEGSEPTPSVDIYAFGIVMYEMVTGTCPFRGGSAFSLAMKRLKEAAPSPRLHVPELDSRWEQVILRCLEREPARRPARVSDIPQALEGSVTLPALSSVRRRRSIVAAAAFALLAIVAAFVVPRVLDRWRIVERPTATAPAIKVRPSVAVLGFKNLSANPEATWVSAALSEMLTSELGANEKLRTISGETVARFRRELNLPDTDALEKQTLSKLRSKTGSDYVVLGSFFVTPGHDQIRVDLRIQDAKAGESIGSVIVTGSEQGLLDLVSRAGAEVRSKLGVGSVTPAEAASALAALPPKPELARLYSEGLTRLRWFDAMQARDLLQKAVALDPKYPLGHAALAAAWSALGHDANAREEAKKAFDLAGSLSREERLLAEGRYRLIAGEHSRAVEVFRSLFEFFPDNIDYGLSLVQAQITAGKAKEALKTIEQLRRLPAPLGDDPRIDIAEADAADGISDYKRAVQASSRAIDAATKKGATILLAKGLNRRGSALQRLGDTAKALEAYERSDQIYTQAGDMGAAARNLTAIGAVLAGQGKLNEAKASYEQALAVHRKIGDDGGAAAALNNLANVALQQGDLKRAESLYGDALNLQKKLRDERSASQTLSQLGSIAAGTGDVAKARKLFEEALATGRAVGDKLGLAAVLGNLGNLAYSQGDLVNARKNYEEALRLGRESGVKNVIISALNSLGTVELDEGKLQAARADCAESLSVARSAQDRTGEATALSNIALVEMWAGDLRSSNEHFAAAVNIWNGIGDKFSMSYTLTDYTSLLIASGSLADARSRAGEALATRDQMKDPSATQNRLALALLALESGDPRTAAAGARAAVAAGEAAHTTDDEAYARAVYSRALITAGDAAAAVREARRAAQMATKSPKVWLRLAVSVAANRVIALLLNDSAAAAALQAAQREARTKGLAGVDLEGRIASAEVAAKTSAAARDKLSQLANEARQRGFLLLANRASAAATSRPNL